MDRECTRSVIGTNHRLPFLGVFGCFFSKMASDLLSAIKRLCVDPR